MKKLALTNLILLLAIKSVSACTVVAGSNIIEDHRSKVFTLLTIALIFNLSTMVFYWFKKSREGLIFIIVSAAVLGFSWATSRSFGSDCGYGAVQISKIALAVTFVCFVAQFVTWLLVRKKSMRN